MSGIIGEFSKSGVISQESRYFNIDSLGRVTMGTDENLNFSKIFTQRTTGVSGWNVIATVGVVQTYGCFYIICGRDVDTTVNRYVDILTAGLNGSINVLLSTTVRGSPASRSYSLSSENLQVAMGSGSNYTINVFAIDQITS